MSPLLHSRSSAPTRLRRSLASALVLGTAALGLTAVAAPASAAPEEVTLTENDSFLGQAGTVHMGMTFDGTSYWEVSGNSIDGERLAQISVDGELIAKYSPGIDFRAISTADNGTIYVSRHYSNVVSRMTAPGVFEDATTLDTAVESQRSIVINQAGDRFLTHADGIVSVWNLDGSLDRQVTLEGWTPTYNNARVRMAETDGLFLTLDPVANLVQGWDLSGSHVASFSLEGINVGVFDVDYSFSAANNAIYVNDAGTWHVFPLSYANVETDSSVTAGDDITATASAYDYDMDLTGETVTFSVYAGETCTGAPVATTTGTIADGEAAAEDIRITTAGNYQWVAEVGDLASRCGAAPFTITAGAIDSLEISPATAEIAFDASQEYTATGADVYDNPIADPAGVIYTIDGGTCVDNVCSAEAGAHTVTATAGDVTATATLVVNPEAPSIGSSPVDTEVLTGGDATFTLETTGGDATVQWQSSSDGEAWTDVDGATGPTLTVTGVNPGLDGTLYRAVVTNSTGTATSDAATLTVPAVGLALADAAGEEIVAGDTVVEGTEVTATLDTLAAGTTVTMELQSEPVVVATPTSDVTGVASATFDVPQIGAGAHTFVVTDAAGAVLASLDLVVEAAAVPSTDEPEAPGNAAPEAELSDTGAHVLPALAIALATAIAGVMLMLSAWRRTDA